MIIKKVITYAVDVYDVIGFYTDPEANMMSVLNHRLRGRCYQGCFILEITSILRMGDCIITRDGAPTHGTVSVIFEVKASILAPGEVVNGCKVTAKDPTGSILCETESAKIMVFDSVPLASVTVGQLISVRIMQQKPTIGETNVAVLAAPFIPVRKQPVYACSALTPEQIATVAPALASALAERTRCETARAASTWKFFDDLIYAWKNPQDVTGLDLVAMATGQLDPPAWVNRDNRLRLVDPVVLGFDAPPAVSIPDTSLDAAAVMVTLLADWEASMRVVREHVEIYSTPALMTGHQNIWRMMTKMKL